MEAAGRAPSQLNSQPWRFVVIEDRDDDRDRSPRISGESMTEAMSNGTFFERYKPYFRFSQAEMEEQRSGMLFDQLPAALRPFTSQVFTKRGQKLMNTLRRAEDARRGEPQARRRLAAAARRDARPERVPAGAALVVLLGVQHGRRDGERLAHDGRARHGHPVHLVPDGGARPVGRDRARCCACPTISSSWPSTGSATCREEQRRPAIDWSSHERKRPSQYVFRETCATPQDGWDDARPTKRG